MRRRFTRNPIDEHNFSSNSFSIGRSGERGLSRQKFMALVKYTAIFAVIVIPSLLLLSLPTISPTNIAVNNFINEVSTKFNEVSAIINHDKNKDKPPCALLFFGLIKEFKNLVYPAINSTILQQNPHCDVYLHTYNLTSIPFNPRSSEKEKNKASKLDITEAYLLTTPDRITFESMQSFHTKRDIILNASRVHHHRGWGNCCISHDNMIKQWNSIQGVWDLMRSHEQKILYKQQRQLRKDNNNTINKSTIQNQDRYYQQIGLFRSDVFYPQPIDIFDGQAVTPSFARHNGYNDRLFYGLYEYAQTWASKRFDFVPTFEQEYMIPYDEDLSQKDGYHSERYVKSLMDNYHVPVTPKDICVWRVRSGPRISIMDCEELEKFDDWKKASKYLPKGRKIEAWG